MPRRQMLGLTAWSAEEIEKLHELARGKTHIKIVEQLLRRNDRAIRRKAAELGLRVGNGTPKRDARPNV